MLPLPFKVVALRDIPPAHLIRCFISKTMELALTIRDTDQEITNGFMMLSSSSPENLFALHRIDSAEPFAIDFGDNFRFDFGFDPSAISLGQGGFWNDAGSLLLTPKGLHMKTSVGRGAAGMGSYYVNLGDGSLTREPNVYETASFGQWILKVPMEVGRHCEEHTLANWKATSAP